MYAIYVQESDTINESDTFSSRRYRAVVQQSWRLNVTCRAYRPITDLEAMFHSAGNTRVS